MTRPRKEFDPPQFEKLCALHCTIEEIAAWFDMCRDTMNERVKEYYGLTFSEAFDKFSADGKMSLRRIQFQMAEKNVAMAIWLGKQWLGQKDTNFMTMPQTPQSLPFNVRIEGQPVAVA